ncbi:MAG: hypothetical protein K6G30_05530 [Acetatifactor sp.]|nr:hypothetical protein [Acetatifactor sp.]
MRFKRKLAVILSFVLVVSMLNGHWGGSVLSVYADTPSGNEGESVSGGNLRLSYDNHYEVDENKAFVKVQFANGDIANQLSDITDWARVTRVQFANVRTEENEQMVQRWILSQNTRIMQGEADITAEVIDTLNSGAWLDLADGANYSFEGIEFFSAGNQGGEGGSGGGPTAPQDYDVDVVFDGDVNGRVITYEIGDANVTLTVPEGIVIDGSNATILNNRARIAVGGDFDASTMEVRIYAPDGFNCKLFVDDEMTTALGDFDAGSFPAERPITIKVESRNNNPNPGGGGDPHEVIINPGDVRIRVTSPFGQVFGEVAYKIGNGDWITLERSDNVDVMLRPGNELGAISNGTNIYIKAMPNNSCFLSNFDHANEFNGQNFTESERAALLSESGWAFTYDSNERYNISIDFDGAGGENHREFNGVMFFIWKGSNDSLCVHRIEGLQGRAAMGGVESFPMNYIPLSTVRDDTTGEAFVIGNRDLAWVWEENEEHLSHFDNFTDLVTWIDTELDEQQKRDFIADPCGAGDGAATVCTNGDRTFRATIYDETKFEGIAFSPLEEQYTYFPNYWDPTFFSNVVDITDTTADRPAEYGTFLLEPTLHFWKADNSIGDIIGVRAIGVPSGAVDIQQNESVFDVEFASNFYDDVTFEIQTATKNYYVKLNRSALSAYDDFGPGTTDNHVIAELLYDEHESYNDYDVYATLNYADGSTVIRKAEASEIQYEYNGDRVPSGTYESEGGKGLKFADFAIECTSDLVSVSFNVTRHGALSGDTYGGSYCGSEKGVTYTVATRRVTY